MVGLLPAGIHPATMDEIRRVFGSSNDVRANLCDGLAEFIELARSFGLFEAIVIDGSFVTDVATPDDIDAVLILPGSRLRTLMQRSDYERLDNAIVRERFRIDLFIDPDHDGMSTFFQGLKVEDALQRGVSPRQRRGVLEVRL